MTFFGLLPDLLAIPADLDLRLLLDFNSLVPVNHVAQTLFYFPAENALVRGFPIFFPLLAMWFSHETQRQRARMATGLLAGCAATIFSVWLQKHIQVDVRPFLDPNLHLRGMDLVPRDDWNHLSSFPSDTATMFFAFSTVVLLEHRIAGAIAYLWSIVITGIIRVAVGWHYPSDVAAGMLLGSGVVLLITRVDYLVGLVEGMLTRFKRRMQIINALFVLFMADALCLFVYDLQILHRIREFYDLIASR